MGDMILINGQPQQTLSIYDRGLQYGDGVFETMAVHNGRIPLWPFHWQRLQRGCERLRLPLPDQTQLEEEWQQIAAGQANAIIKIIYTRGSGGRGYQFPEHVQPTRIVVGYPWREYPAEHSHQGVSIRLCATRLSSNPQLAGIKHLNRLEQILARNEWQNANCVEGLMLNQQNQVIDGTMSNLFIVRERKLLTPALDEAGVAGVMRALILQIAETTGISYEIGHLSLADVQTADELFICNSVFGIWPVTQLEQHRYLVGVQTRQLQQAITDYITQHCA